jgi:enamine deaminase RidA (YjgF/YER057c/UK114 family)
METLGGSFDDIVQVEQYVPYKAYADGYLEVRNGPGFMERDRCSSALMCSGDMDPGVVIIPTAIAYAPGYDLKKEVTFSGPPKPALPEKFGSHYAKEAPTGEITIAGPYVFTTVTAIGGLDDVHPDVKVTPGVWWGNEIRNELRFGLRALRKKLEVAGTDPSNAMHCTVHLTHIDDLYEFDLVWKEVFGDTPPARTVVPVRGLFMPRKEGARGHTEGAIRMELQFRSLRPGFGITKEIVETDLVTFGEEPVATRAGSLLWISGQLGGTLEGVVGDGGIQAQLSEIFRRIEVICKAGGTDLSNLLRLRAYVLDPADGRHVFAALKSAVPTNPPAVCVIGVPGPLQVPGCSIIVDAVAHIPGTGGF